MKDKTDKKTVGEINKKGLGLDKYTKTMKKEEGKKGCSTIT